MNLPTPVLKALLGKGLTLADVVEIAEIWEEGASQPVPEISKGALRTRKWREKREAEQVEASPRDVTETVTETHHGDVSEVTPPLSLPPSPQTPQPPTHTREKNTTRVKRASRRCPEDWRPSERTLGKLIGEEAFAIGDLERALTRMKDHEFRDAHSDWDAVFRNWVRTDRDRRSQPGKPNAQHRTNQAPAAAREDRLGRMLRGAMAAVDECEAELGGRRTGTGG